MSALSTQMESALSADRATVTLLIEVTLPDHVMRLLAGAGAVAWGTKTFAGVDSRFGTLAAADAIEDGAGDQAPAFSFTVMPPSNIAAADIASASYQGSPVSVWLAAVHPTSGLLIPDPYLLFTGVLDQPVLKVGRGTRSVDFDCVSDFDRLLEEDEGARLTDSFHQSLWPGELGFANVTGVEQTVYWGTANPNPGAPIYTTLPPGALFNLFQ
ncbi:hypothetical protein [Rhizorhabdus sp.]|uniref:hypothetical protein n=1 Tax=Rhizorhabdus sp. TaxID=1968843 RepID=UPI0035B16928